MESSSESGAISQDRVGYRTQAEISNDYREAARESIWSKVGFVCVIHCWIASSSAGLPRWIETRPRTFSSISSAACGDGGGSSRGFLDRFVPVLYAEMLLEERRTLSEALFGEHDRLRLAHWVLDRSFLMEPIHHIPIESFPRATTGVERQKEHRERNFVDFILIIFHALMFCLFTRRCNASLSANPL
jgi:hypothetical protein